VTTLKQAAKKIQQAHRRAANRAKGISPIFVEEKLDRNCAEYVMGYLHGLGQAMQYLNEVEHDG